MTHQTPSPDREARYQQFDAALTLVGGVCHRAQSTAQAATIIADLIEASKGTDPPIWTAPMVREAMPELVAALKSQGCTLRYPEAPADVRDQPFGLSVAETAIAETGSVLLIERFLDDRSVGLMTETHIVICALDDLAESLDDAGETLASITGEHGSYATLVTGPSRTADIERQLTIGVQGPSHLHVILVAEPA